MPTESLVIIGGASLDTLHFKGRTVKSAGGAGLYTALAASRAGADVTMIGPRPDPIPAELRVAAQLLDWRGEKVPPEELPSFEISHFGGGATEMEGAHWRAEGRLRPESLPSDLPLGLAYCCPLADPALQLEFVRHFKHLGYRVACGTFQKAVTEYLPVVEESLNLSDIFFCNRSEAERLFGGVKLAKAQPGKLLFVTCSQEGALVLQGHFRTDVPGVAVEEIDPTGAGDTFCGTVLAHIVRGEHPVRAAGYAVDAAARMVTRVGPDYLLEQSSEGATERESEAVADPGRIEVVGEVLQHLPEASAFDFTGDDYPPLDHPFALDFFFAATLQQFGFWTTSNSAYEAPMFASIDGRQVKGSDFIWAAYRRWLEEDPESLTPVGQAELDQESFDYRLRSDSGSSPLPAAELHLQQARSYGRDLLDLGEAPQSIVSSANRSSQPLRSFLLQLDHIGGYKEDPLRKKSALLAAILSARPERFLRWGADEEIPPIIDYHLQRSCLRIGLVEVRDDALRRRLEARQMVAASDELAIREAAYEALVDMQRQTGKRMAALDWFFFQNRHRCPEMTEPICAECPIDSVCAHRKELFQPVFRTSFY